MGDRPTGTRSNLVTTIAPAEDLNSPSSSPSIFVGNNKGDALNPSALQPTGLPVSQVTSLVTISTIQTSAVDGETSASTGSTYLTSDISGPPALYPNVSASPPQPPPRIPAGSIAGAVVGAVALLAVTAFLLCFTIRKQRLGKNNGYDNLDSYTTTEAGPTADASHTIILSDEKRGAGANVSTRPPSSLATTAVLATCSASTDIERQAQRDIAVPRRAVDAGRISTGDNMTESSEGTLPPDYNDVFNLSGPNTVSLPI